MREVTDRVPLRQRTRARSRHRQANARARFGLKISSPVSIGGKPNRTTNWSTTAPIVWQSRERFMRFTCPKKEPSLSNSNPARMKQAGSARSREKKFLSRLAGLGDFDPEAAGAVNKLLTLRWLPQFANRAPGL